MKQLAMYINGRFENDFNAARICAKSPKAYANAPTS